jgi:hypothetical protein
MTAVDYHHFLRKFLSHPFAGTVINTTITPMGDSHVPNLEPAFFAAHGTAAVSLHYRDSLQLGYQVLFFMTP